MRFFQSPNLILQVINLSSLSGKLSRTDVQHYLDGAIADVDLLKLAAAFVADRSMSPNAEMRPLQNT